MMRTFVLVLAVASYSAEAWTAQTNSRRLRVAPLLLPDPFNFPKDVGNSARQARQSKSTGDFARQMCEIIASPSVQSTREFRDVEGVKLWPMFENIARAAYIYSDDVVQVWGEVFATCNKMGGKAAEGVGYGTAFIFSEGLVESLGLIQVLQAAYARTGSCASVDNILDVAAAVITSRDVAANELKTVMMTYDKRLVPCTPGDEQQRFEVPSSAGSVKPSNALHGGSNAEPAATAESPAAPKATEGGAAKSTQTPSTSTSGNGNGSKSSNGASKSSSTSTSTGNSMIDHIISIKKGASGGSRVPVERGRDVAGR